MTKMNKLTKQYYKGTLETGHYYFSNCKEIYPIYHQQITGLTPCKESGVSVVDKIPDYYALQYLKKKLVQAKPELEAWVVKHYGELERD